MSRLRQRPPLHFQEPCQCLVAYFRKRLCLPTGADMRHKMAVARAFLQERSSAVVKPHVAGTVLPRFSQVHVQQNGVTLWVLGFVTGHVQQ